MYNRISGGSSTARSSWLRDSEVNAPRSEVKPRLECAVKSDLPATSAVRFEVGSVGKVWGWMKVIEVVDKSNMIVNWTDRTTDQRLWLEGFSSDGITDDKMISVSGPVIVSGTKQYESNVGKATVLVIKPVIEDVEKVSVKAAAARECAEEAAKAENERKAAAEAAKWRTWTDSFGQHTIEAEFSGMIAGNVKLTKKDGATIQLPLEKLSDEDQKWIESRIKK